MAPTVYRLLPALLPRRRLNHTGCRPCRDHSRDPGPFHAPFNLVGYQPCTDLPVEPHGLQALHRTCKGSGLCSSAVWISRQSPLYRPGVAAATCCALQHLHLRGLTGINAEEAVRLWMLNGSSNVYE